MAVTDTAVAVDVDRVEVHLGKMDETPGSNRATARHTVHVFGDADLLRALGADLMAAADVLAERQEIEAAEATLQASLAKPAPRRRKA